MPLCSVFMFQTFSPLLIPGPALLPDNRIINRQDEKRMEESLETDESRDKVFFFREFDAWFADHAGNGFFRIPAFTAGKINGHSDLISLLDSIHCRHKKTLILKAHQGLLFSVIPVYTLCNISTYAWVRRSFTGKGTGFLPVPPSFKWAVR